MYWQSRDVPFWDECNIIDNEKLHSFATAISEYLLEDHRLLKKIVNFPKLVDTWEYDVPYGTVEQGVTLVSETYRAREVETISDTIALSAVSSDQLPYTLARHVQMSLRGNLIINFEFIY